ncbi:MAG: ABC transporter substrate-binding protein [Propionibacteriaceae bacterium]|jgi:peptide/nickel transport system substrate-binding protein|nr:ABC transporter substrate-binding protein [Propionibacteriaceae bacterium]
MKSSRIGVVAALIVGMALIISGCTTPPADAKTLTVGITVEPTTLDLTTDSTAAIPQILLYNVYETLVKMDSQGRIKPLLADSYDVSPDWLTYTFHLDTKAKFASGAPVNADAVVASINTMREAPNQTLKSQMAVVADVQARDQATVAVTLKEPSNFWLYSMTDTVGIIFDPALTDLATAPMGSGPYAFESWVSGDSITLTKNESYWGTPGRFDEVVFRFIADPNAMVSAMLSGDLDIAGEMTSPDSLELFSDASKYTVIEGTTNGEIVLGFNNSRETLKDLAVRQAICHAIDRQALVDAVWAGKGQLIGSMAVPTDPYYEDLSATYPYDPAKAKELLEEAGVTNLSLDLRIPTLPYTPGAATFIASQLADVGITVKVEELDFGRWIDEVYSNGDYDMTIVAHVEARDIVNFANPDYYWRYDNPEFQKQLASAIAASPDQFVPEMKKAATILAEDAAADWLFVFPNLIVTREGINGVGENMTSLSFDVTTISSKD